jgi:protein-tyrosine-phosphatase
MSRLPAAVLFACNFNKVRSPMAEGLMRRLYGDAVYVDSCGLSPTEGIDPMAVQVMDEAGVDLSAHVAKGFEDLVPESFDLVISFTPQSHAQAEAASRACAVTAEFWPLFDPTAIEGSRDAVLDGYRQLRDTLASKLVERFGPPSAG